MAAVYDWCVQWYSELPEETAQYLRYRLETMTKSRENAIEKLAACRARKQEEQHLGANPALEVEIQDWEEEVTETTQEICAATRKPIPGEADLKTLQKELDRYMETAPKGQDFLGWVHPSTWLELTAEKTGPKGDYQHDGRFLHLVPMGHLAVDELDITAVGRGRDRLYTAPSFLTLIPNGVETYLKARRNGLDPVAAINATTDVLNEDTTAWLEKELPDEHAKRLRDILDATRIHAFETSRNLNHQRQGGQDLNDHLVWAGQDRSMTAALVDAWQFWTGLTCPPNDETINVERVLNTLRKHQTAEPLGGMDPSTLAYVPAQMFSTLYRQLELGEQSIEAVLAAPGCAELIRPVVWLEEDAIGVNLGYMEGTRNFYAAPAHYTDIEDETYCKMRQDGISRTEALNLTKFATRPVKIKNPGDKTGMSKNPA